MKRCTVCQAIDHTAFYCKLRPHKPLRAKKPMKKIGKVTKNWLNDRQAWVHNNPPDHSGYWYCYLRLPGCENYMTRQTLTLDHVSSRTRVPGQRRKQSNFRPACAPCNEKKGSRDLIEMEEYGEH